MLLQAILTLCVVYVLLHSAVKGYHVVSVCVQMLFLNYYQIKIVREDNFKFQKFNFWQIAI